jgi:hypothetical protein
MGKTGNAYIIIVENVHFEEREGEGSIRLRYVLGKKNVRIGGGWD